METDSENLNDDRKTVKDSPQTNADKMEGSGTGTTTTTDEDEMQMEVVREPIPKKLKLDESTASTISVQTSSLNEEIKGNNSSVETLEEMKARIKMKEDILHKLQKVEFYKKKWNIEELKKQIRDWKVVAIDAFEDLYQKSCAEKESLTKEELLEHLGVDPDMLGIEILK